jgi:hypothetical protein
MCIRLFEASEGVVAVEFTKLNGNQIQFLEEYNKLSESLGFLNDTLI